jgi:hypothetical protein
MGFHRQVLDRAQRLDAGKKNPGVLPTDPCLPAAIGQRFVQLER